MDYLYEQNRIQNLIRYYSFYVFDSQGEHESCRTAEAESGNLTHADRRVEQVVEDVDHNATIAILFRLVAAEAAPGSIGAQPVGQSAGVALGAV